MAVVLIDSTIKGSADGDTVTTDPIDTTGANLIVLAVAQYDSFGVITDTYSNTWTRAAGSQLGFFATVEFFYCLSPIVGSGHTFTHTPDNLGKRPTIAATAWSGAGTVIERENTASNSGTVATTNEIPVTNGSLIVTVASAENTDTLTVDSPYSILDQVSYSVGLHASLSTAYDIVSADGDVSSTWRWTTSTGASGAAIFGIAATPSNQIRGSFVAGQKTTVVGDSAAAFGLDGNTNVHDESGKLKVFGNFEVTGDAIFDGTVELPADSVLNSDLSNMAQATIKGRADSAGTGDPTDLTADQVSTILDGATDPFVRTSDLGGGGGSGSRTVGITIDGAGSVISTGVKGFVSVPFSGTITKALLLSTDASVTSGSIVIDVWKDTYANYPPTGADTITASAKPTISGATKSEDSTLTGWTTAVSVGDVFGFNVDSVTSLTRVTLELTVVV